MSIMAKTPSGYKKIGSAYLGERPVDKVFNANGDVVYVLQRELTGVPPLLFKGKEQSELLNYRIYGDTVDGNSVGDLVESGEHAGEYKVPVTVEGKNLWSGVVEQGSVSTFGNYANDLSRIRSKNISLSPGVYTISCNLAIRCIYAYNNNEKVSCVVDNGGGNMHSNTFTVPSDANNVSIGLRAFDASGSEIANVKPSDFKWGQIEEGITATPYEPYHAPVTTPIYLPEQIRKVGDEAEYIDYAEQKMHRVRKNLFDINNLEDHYDISLETGLPAQDSAYSRVRCAITTPINVSAGDYYLTFNKNIAGEIGFIVSVFENNTLISRTPGYHSGSRIRISSGNNIYIGFYNQNVTAAIHPSDVSNIMLNSGTEPLPYEPYIENTDLDVTLPALPAIKGTNQMSIDTEVQPSRMDIKGRIKSLT